MKKIFLFIISIGLLSLVSCEKEEVPVAPTTSSTTPVFKYDNTTVEGVVAAANYVMPKAGGGYNYNCVWGIYKGYDPRFDYIYCEFNLNYVCYVIIEAKGKANEDSDILIAAPEVPIVRHGNIELINTEDGTSTYQIITDN